MQPEIWDYLRKVTDDFGIRPHIRLGCEVEDCTWDETSMRWHIATSRGSLTARILIAAAGGLCEPSIPSLPGLETFEGAAFHTARWDHDQDLSDKRIAVVGTGASGVQVVPNIQPLARKLTVFQRTPPWIMPHPGRAVRAGEKRLFRLLPAIQQAVRGVVYWSRELYVLPFKRKRFRRFPERVALHHIAEQVPDPDLRRKLTPDYEIGCKRILLSNEYYPALQQPNVELVTEAVVEVRPASVITADGREHAVDTIVWGTGFRVTEMPVGDIVHGREGRLLGDIWREHGVQALRGTAISGFPNLFMLIGPNTGLGHNSIVFIIESQLAYVMDALETMENRGAAVVEARPESQAAFNDGLQARMAGTVWTEGGCASWYLDRHGRNRTLWPGTSWSFRQATRRFDPSEYVLEAGVPTASEAATV
jgi:cation diffusion facilitator CzcD-associated flavoprotein CzcO